MLGRLRHIKRIINPHGGILFCMDEIRKMGVPKLLDKKLGKRVKQAKYKHSDIILSWIYSMLCESERLEDTKYLKEYFEDIPNTKHPSPDRIAGIFKSFATETDKFKNKNIKHEFNINIPMNGLMLDTALHLKELNTTTEYVMDYDDVPIECEKFDAKYTYKKFDGYLPGAAFIGETTVYVEGRGGNSTPGYKIDETVGRALALQESKNIKVKRFRSDAAGYTYKITHLMDDKGIEFFVRADNSEKAYSEVLDNGKWREVKLGTRTFEVTSASYEFFGRTFRLVASRGFDDIKNYHNKYTEDNKTYRLIMTNNWDMSEEDVIHFYNQRGKIENNFRELLNDWNWKRVPFSYLNQNVVFMIMGAIGRIIYKHLLRKFSRKLKFIQPNMLLKAFRFCFIAVSLEWIIEGDEKIPVLSSVLRDYSLLLSRPPT